MNGYMAGSIGAGIAEASKEVQKGMVQAYDIKSRRDLQAQQLQRQNTLDIQRQSQFEQESKLKDIQLQQMQIQLKQLTDDIAKKDTYSGFDAYRVSKGDTKFLNNKLKNPNIKKVAKGINGFYKIDINSQQDLELLKKKGLTPEDIEDEKSDAPRYVKVTIDNSNPGSFEILDLYTLYAGTGYMNTMKKEEIEALTLKAKKLALKKEQSVAGLQKIKTKSEVEAQDFLQWKKIPGNENKTFSEYEQIGKPVEQPTVTTATLKDEYANLKIEASNGELSKDKQVRMDVLNKLFSTDNDEKRQILSDGIKITSKYKGNLFDIDINDKDIIAAKLYAQQAGIKPDAKANRELKDQFNTVKTGKRLVKEIEKLGDEELSRGLYDTGIQKMKKLLSDKKFEDMSEEEKAKALTSINMNTKLGMFLAKYIKSISGTAVAEAEYNRLKDLFSGSSFDNIQSLKEGVKAFVGELDTQFKDSLQTSLLDNPATTLDLAKRYKDLTKDEEAPAIQKEEASVATDTYDDKYEKFKDLIGQVNPKTGKKLIGFEEEAPFNPIYEEVQ